MSAFDAAMASLIADPNLAIAVEWRAAAGGEWRPLRVALTTAAQEIGAIGARGVALEALLRVADLSPDTPRRPGALRRWNPMLLASPCA
jgi:hypothetical protein